MKTEGIEVPKALKACMRRFTVRTKKGNYRVAAYDERMAKDVIILDRDLGISESDIVAAVMTR